MAEAAVKIRDRMWTGVLRVAAPQKSDSDALRGDALQTRRRAVGVQLWARGKGRSTIRCCFFAGTRAPKNTAVGWGVSKSFRAPLHFYCCNESPCPGVAMVAGGFLRLQVLGVACDEDDSGSQLSRWCRAENSSLQQRPGEQKGRLLVAGGHAQPTTVTQGSARRPIGGAAKSGCHQKI